MTFNRNFRNVKMKICGNPIFVTHNTYLIQLCNGDQSIIIPPVMSMIPSSGEREINIQTFMLIFLITLLYLSKRSACRTTLDIFRIFLSVTLYVFSQKGFSYDSDNFMGSLPLFYLELNIDIS